MRSGRVPDPWTPLFGDGTSLRDPRNPSRPVAQTTRARAWTASGAPTPSQGLRWGSDAMPIVSSAYPYRQKHFNSFRGYLSFEYVGKPKPLDATITAEEYAQSLAHGASPTKGDYRITQTVTLEEVACGRAQVPRGTILSGAYASAAELAPTQGSEAATPDEYNNMYAESSDDLESIGSDDELAPETAPAAPSVRATTEPARKARASLEGAHGGVLPLLVPPPPLHAPSSTRRQQSPWRLRSAELVHSPPSAASSSPKGARGVGWEENVPLARRALARSVAEAMAKQREEAEGAEETPRGALDAPLPAPSAPPPPPPFAHTQSWSAAFSRLAALREAGEHEALLAELRGFSLADGHSDGRAGEEDERSRKAFEGQHGAAARRAVALLGVLAVADGKGSRARSTALFDEALAALRGNRYGALGFDVHPPTDSSIMPLTGLTAEMGGEEERAAPAAAVATAGSGSGAPRRTLGSRDDGGELLSLEVEAAIASARVALQPVIQLSWQPLPDAPPGLRYQLEVATVCPFRGQLEWTPVYSGVRAQCAWREAAVGKWSVGPGMLELGSINDFAFRVRAVARTGASAFTEPLLVQPPRVRLQRARRARPVLSPAYLRHLGLLDLLEAESNARAERGASGGDEPAQGGLALLAVMQRWLPELRTVFRDACVQGLEEKPAMEHVYSLSRAQFLRFVRGALDVSRRTLPTVTLDTIFARVQRARGKGAAAQADGVAQRDGDGKHGVLPPAVDSARVSEGGTRSRNGCAHAQL